MKNKRKFTALFSLIIMVISLGLTLVFLSLPDDKRFMSPVLLFFFLLGIGFGVMAIVYGIVKRFSGYFFLSSFLFGIIKGFLFISPIKAFNGFLHRKVLP